MRKAEKLAQLKRLALFAKVVELGSFSKAAHAFEMSRSGISEQIALLEAHLNTRLLHRTTRTLSLTSDGEKVLPEAVLILQSLVSVFEKLDKHTLSGVIRLTTTHSFAIQWLSPRLKAFQALYPEVTFDLILSDDNKDVIEDQIDIALRIGNPPNDRSLITRPLMRQGMQIYASPEILGDAQSVETLDDILKLPWILVKQLINNTGTALISTKNNVSFNLKPPRANLVDSPVVLVEQIKMGLGVGLLFPSTIEKELERGELMHILPNWHTEEKLFYILHSARRQLPLRVKTFIDFLL